MKRILPCFMILFMLSALLFGSTLTEQDDMKKANTSSYRITWDVVPAGGEINANSTNYRVSSTVGQTGTDILSGSNHLIFSGFWNPSLIGMVTSVEPEKAAEMPKSYRLNQNYPNPFNPVTTIRYDLPASSRVTIEIYNTLGHRIRVLVDETKEAGFHTVQWDGRDGFGHLAGNGVFIYRIIARSPEGDSYTRSLKMLLVK